MLAGAGDHIGAREHAANHREIGHVGLALKFVTAWLDFQIAAEAEGLVDATM